MLTPTPTQAPTETPRTLLIVDDDMLSREVLCLVAAEAGFSATPLESGEAALAHLALTRPTPPSALLVDMQMPGLCGDALAERLRPACGPAALLLAMSGSPVEQDKRLHYDGFLLKPFDFDTFVNILSSAPQAMAPATPTLIEVLNLTTYKTFAQTMPPAQLHALYAMCLDDAGQRLQRMRAAMTAGDAEEYCRAAHAIKGSCGMVGALELAALASTMEQDGPPSHAVAVDHLDPFAEFLAATARLRSMLDAQA